MTSSPGQFGLSADANSGSSKEQKSGVGERHGSPVALERPGGQAPVAKQPDSYGLGAPAKKPAEAFGLDAPAPAKKPAESYGLDAPAPAKKPVQSYGLDADVPKQGPTQGARLPDVKKYGLAADAAPHRDVPSKPVGSTAGPSTHPITFTRLYTESLPQDGPYPARQHHDTLLSTKQELAMYDSYQSGIIQSGWLHKLVGKTPQDVAWKKYWFYLVGDRLYYSPDAMRDKPVPGSKARYIALDRIPVRPLPHRRKYAAPDTKPGTQHFMTEPDVGISMVRNEVLAHLKVKLMPDTCFGMVTGSHTLFLAADSPKEARTWVKVLKQAWAHCYNHTLRGTDANDAVHQTSRLLAQNEALRQSLILSKTHTRTDDSEHWKNWLEEKARNRLLMEAMAGNVVYEVEVKTGARKGGSTSARVSIEMYGAHDDMTTGPIRLVNLDSHALSFQRGATDVFLVTAKDIGLPRTIKIWHDNTGRHPDWFLDYVRIRKRAGKAPLGPAPQVTSSLADPRMPHFPTSPNSTAVYQAAAICTPPRTRQAKPRVLGMSCSSFGDSTLGSPSRHSINNRPGSPAYGYPGSPSRLGPAYAGNASPRPGTGSLQKHTDMRSSQGLVPGASQYLPDGANHLQFLDVACSQWVTFPCQRWFSTTKEDCRISRVLFAGHQSPLIQYKVVTVTSNMRGASTDAHVHLVMHGTLGDGVRHVLTSGPNDFERGAVNEFIIDDEELGDLLHATIGHDGSGQGPSWHLDHMKITNCKTGQTYAFVCRQWFDKHMGDGLIERTLPAVPDAGKLVPYTFVVYTSDMKGAGTDADVHVALHGSLGDTATTILPSRPEHFERGSIDTFKGVVLPYVGDMKALTIGHNDQGPRAEWHLQMVEVIDEQHGKHYWFVCGKWFGSKADDGGALVRTLKVCTDDPRGGFASYKVEFHTSAMRGAGTDATVYFQLMGDNGDGETQRVVAAQEAFERGGVDTYTYRMRFLGKLRRMIVQHDNSGANPAWHLYKVVVTCDKDGSVTTFLCNDWLKSSVPDVYPCVELVASQGAPGTCTYRLEVATSDLRGAGTDSSIWVEVHGNQGKVSAQQLDGPGAFERGARDSLSVWGMDVGQLTKLVVSVQPVGTRPLWHLEHILVTKEVAGGVKEPVGTWFPCREWFDEAHGMTRELYPMRRELDLPQIWYNITVGTSDIKGAGTDANIEVNLLGSKGETGWYALISNNKDIFERAQEDSFKLHMMDVGSLVGLLLRTDARSAKPAWHVDYVVVEPEAGLPPTYFMGRCWLGPAPQHPQEVKLLPVSEDPRKDRADYMVWIHTSDVRLAGTDAGITIEILGERGSSGRQPCTSMTKDLFERAQVDEFRVRCRQLGALKSLKVITDGKSTKPNWHLDYVIIQVPTGEKYFFCYAGWLGPEKLEVELPASLVDPSQGRRKYRVVVCTTDIRSAGTDANVYVDIRGSLGATGKQFLKNSSKDCFERGQVDEFEVQAAGDLGPLTELVLGHDNSGQGPSWHCEQVEVTDILSGQTWYFECNQWFDQNQGDCKIERCLKASLQNPRSARTVYKVCVKTSNKPDASTDARVYIEIRGQGGSSGKQFLKNSASDNFNTGATDEFQLPLRSLGALSEIVLGHDSHGLNPSWHCELVTITDLGTQTTYWFACNKWFSKDKDDGRTERVLPASLQPPAARRNVPYQITVQTSDLSGAGTDANVFIIMYGEDGADTGRLVLDKKGNNFERNQKDVFTVTAKEVDPLRKLRVGHDNSAPGSAWHLASIEVLNTLTGAKYIFPCNRWFSTKHDDFQIERDLYPLGSNVQQHTYTIEVFTSNLAGAGTDATIRCIIYGEKGETGSLMLDNPKNNFEAGDRDVFNIQTEDVGALRKLKIWSDGKGLGSAWHLDIVTISSSCAPDVKWWFYCGQWFDDAHGLENLLSACSSDPRGSLPTYTITVHTSDISGAGTDANVFLNIFGAKGESGVRDLKGKGNLFEQGKTDVFQIKMLDLGDLSEMDIWHDNSGLGAAWHLNYVEVTCSTDRKVFYFPCNRWFDKKQDDGLIKRRLKATLKDPRSFNSDYRVTTVTSDISGAGTDADVFINIYGKEGETGKINLDNPMKNDFERGSTDVFEFTAPSVGKPITKIRIGHNGSGLGAGWHLAKVIVENLSTGECAAFECNRWFDKSEDDGAIERDLFPSSSIVDGVNWKLVIITGSDRGAGTDADVFVGLRGDLGSFGPYTLSAQKGAFENGARDVFSLTTPKLGAIQTMTLGHNGKGMGAAWQVDEAELENMATGEKWYFKFNCWLDAKHGMSATRPPYKYKPATKGGKANYRVEITTGPTEESRMDKGAVVVDIKGKEVSTGRQTLDAPPQGFWPSRVEAYGLASLLDTGGITQLEMGHTSPEPWLVKEVLVVNETTGARGLFLIDKLIMPGEFLVFDAQAAQPVDYLFEIATSDRWNAGTSAHVFVNLYGMQASTGRVMLDDAAGKGSTGTLPSFCSTADACSTKSAAFSRGGRGTFTLRALPDVGVMQQLEIGHDDAGMSPGWHLEWVKATNLATGASALFPCSQWLAKNEGDKKIVRLLDAEACSTTAPPTCSAPSPTPHQLPQGPLMPPQEHWQPPQPHRSEPAQVASPHPAHGVVTVQVRPPEAQAQALTPLMRKLGMGSLGPPGYKLTFVTSNVVMAGTSAPVFFELVGENGSTGTVMVKAQLGQFARSSHDEFVYPRLPFLGELMQLRVGTTGQGMFCNWHLKVVDVTHLSSGTTWRFNCHGWVDKKCSWQRVLHASRV